MTAEDIKKENAAIAKEYKELLKDQLPQFICC